MVAIKDTGESEVAAVQPAVAPAVLHPIHAWWTVIILMSLQVVSLLDRNIMLLMIIEVRIDLGLNDFQISVLQGAAFTAFYAIAGLFIGVLVDRYSARRIIYVCVTVWSLAATACGLAKGYWGMMVARMVTGIGEGGINPSAVALIMSTFPKNRVSLPASLFTISGSLGLGLAFFGGGVLLEMFTERSVPGLEDFAPWRQVVIVTAVPGLILALFAFTLLESRPLAKKTTSTLESWKEVWRFLASERQLFSRLGACRVIGLRPFRPGHYGRHLRGTRL